MPVVPDGGGEGQDSLENSDQNAVLGMSAVPFESELSLEGLIYGFDNLSNGVEQDVMTRRFVTV
ncbi:MAG: hypothetical protein JXA67_12495 [Micromonosporaceae bacterium]|nr:hypothetical protein [Micromonosporaceae bacterium]